MSVRIGVVISTFGDDSWRALADRAAASALAQTRPADDIVRVHGQTLHGARNAGVEQLDADWVVMLDADDSLDAGYLAAMERMIDAAGADGDWLVQPSTLGVYPDGREDPTPAVIPPKPLRDMNFLVIGTALRRDSFLAIGGFRAFDYAEDWDLMQRLYLAGARPVTAPGAIYRVTVRPDSRNNCPRDQQVRTYRAIRDANAAAWAAHKGSR